MEKAVVLKKKELKLIVKLEHEELKQFNKLVTETLDDVEKTRKELKVEERIKLNLHFIHYKLRQIHRDITDIIALTKNSEKQEINLELNHRIKSIIRHIVELDKEFIPAVRKNLYYLSQNEHQKFKLAADLQHEFHGYKNVIDKLKLLLDISELSSKDIEKMEGITIQAIKASVVTG